MRKKTANLFAFLHCIAALPVFGGNAIHVGSPTATPTFECVGVELPFAGDDDRDAFCDIQFRESGTTRWNHGLRMHADHYTDRTGFRGSVVHLKPGKAYDISLTYTDPDGGSGKQEINASTWSETFPQGDIVQVKSQNRPLELESGSPGAYRVYDGALNKAVVDVNDAQYCANIENKSYIILRNITFRESDRATAS